MSRFREPPDPVFHALNASIGFDRRLAPYDVRQSKAHVSMLAEAGILEAAEADELLRGLDAVGGRARGRAPLRSTRGTRTSTWRSSAG